MIAVRAPVPLSPETIERLMLYGRRVDKEIEKIIGQPAIFAMALALEMPGGLVMHRMANTDVGHAWQLFQLASTTPMQEQFIQTLQEH